MAKKTKARASADFGLIFITYNLRKIINIIGKAPLMAYLRDLLAACFTAKTRKRAHQSILSEIKLFLAIIQKMKFLSFAYCQNYNAGYLPYN